MISHGQAASNMVTPRILRDVEREIPEMGGGRVAVSFLFLSTKMTSTVLLRLRVKLLSFDHNSMCSISANHV